MSRRPAWVGKLGKFKPGMFGAHSLPDAKVRRTRARRREGSIEESCRLHAHEQGWTSRKMNGLGFRDWPDRLFIPPNKKKVPRSFTALRRAKLMALRTFWVEFKRPGEEPTPSQWERIRSLRERGETVKIFTSKGEFIEYLRLLSC